MSVENVFNSALKKSPSTYQPPSEINEIKIAFEIRSPSQPIIKRKKQLKG